jgi:hypothetical protein
VTYRDVVRVFIHIINFDFDFYNIISNEFVCIAGEVVQEQE